MTVRLSAHTWIVLLAAALPAGAAPQDPGTARPPHLRPAERAPAACGPQAKAAAGALDAAARTGVLDADLIAALLALASGGEALRHADLAVLTLAVAVEQAIPSEGVSRDRREALLGALLGPSIPRTECLTRDTWLRLRGVLLYHACTRLRTSRVPVERWAEDPLRAYLLLAERCGPPVSGECGRSLRIELGDTSLIGAGAPRQDQLPEGQGSAIVPPP